MSGSSQLNGPSAEVPHTAEIYVGALIEHESERRVLNVLVDYLTEKRLGAVIFANINVRTRQIDFVVATSQVTLLIEAKGYTRSVRGNASGEWETRTATGGWIKIRNPYTQALAATHALRDEMRAFSGEEIAYPDAAVIIAPDIPPGSDITTGDFKVSISGLSGIETRLSASSRCTWALERWRAYAASLHLTRVQSVAAAYSHQFAEAEQTIQTYSESFRRTYSPIAAGLVADTFSLDERMLRSDEIVQHVVDGHADILLCGPSGCGKTLLATQIGVSFLEKQGIPLMLQVRHYEGNLKEVLDREVALLGVPSAATLLRAARMLDARLLLIADGYNECNEREKLTLTRSLCAAALRYGAQVVVTTQFALERSDLLNLEVVSVREPSSEVKAAISGIDLKDTSDDGLRALVNSVSSGLEARLVGEIGNDLKEGASRFALFDAFARSRLLEYAAEGIGLLARVSALLLQRLSFSLSVRDLERLAEAAQLPHAVARSLTQTQLLISRGGRVSFRHELFFDAFTAEAVVRQAKGNARNILAALGSPRYHASRVLILGAIDDEALLCQVLEELAIPELLAACCEGQCGQAARAWVVAKCDQIATVLRQEAAQVQFTISDGGWGSVAVDPCTLRPWSPQDRAILDVIATGLRNGERLDIFLDAIGAMDASLERCRVDLIEEARQKKVSLRSGMFANAYVFKTSEAAGVTRISASLHGGWYSLRPGEMAPEHAWLEQAWGRSPTPGQIYFLLMISRGREDADSIVAPYLVALVRERWRQLPYHLQLDLMDCLHWCRHIEEPIRSSLIEALEALLQNGNPLFNGMVFEALEALGALESSQTEQTETVRSQVRDLLSSVPTSDSRDIAWSIYVAQFDHPLSGAYIDVVQELDDEQRKRFLMRACEGVAETSLFLTPLIIDLADYGDAAAGPSIEKWARLPARDSFMPQEAIAIFVSAHIALGHLGFPIPAHGASATSSTSAALSACGALHYWTSRRDISDSERSVSCERLWSVLMQHDEGAAVAAVLACENSLRHGMVRVLKVPSDQRSLVRRFPVQSALICREALHRIEKQVRYFPHAFMGDQHSEIRFSIDVLGEFGNAADLAALRALSDDPDLGTSAIAAIRKLEAREIPST